MISNATNSKEVYEELKKTNKLLALIATQGRGQSEKILLLAQVGLTPKEISEVLGVTPNLVSVTLHKQKKKVKKKS